MSIEDTERLNAGYEQELGRADAVRAGATASGSAVACPGCGEGNGAANLHCEHCGVFLAGAREDPRAAETSQTVFRAIATLVALVGVIAVVSVMVRSPRTGADPGVRESTSSTTQTPAPTIQRPVAPSSVEASSELDGHHAPHLIDGDASSYWNDASLAGEGAELMFRFESPTTFAAIEFANVAEEDARRRNFRMRGFEIHVGDGADPVVGELRDTTNWQRVDLGLAEADTVVIHVLSTYPAEPFGGGVPFLELALAEVRFFQSELP